jgi:hypothetical protein
LPGFALVPNGAVQVFFEGQHFLVFELFQKDAEDVPYHIVGLNGILEEVHGHTFNQVLVSAVQYGHTGAIPLLLKALEQGFIVKCVQRLYVHDILLWLKGMENVVNEH